MGHHFSLKAALVGGSALLFLSAAPLRAQFVINPNFELPADSADSTSTSATGWTLSPAPGVGTPPPYVNLGQRAAFYTPTPSGGRWSFWLQTFTDNGSATQTVTGVTAGKNYTLGAQFLFELGSNGTQGPGNGYDAIPTINSYLSIQYEDSSGDALGSPDVTNIGPTVALNRTFAPYSASGVAPAGATQALVSLGWTGGGTDDATGSQSAFATDVSFAAAAVPEPASLSVLSVGGMALLARRRAARKA
jgi:hypothetical protein